MTLSTLSSHVRVGLLASFLTAVGASTALAAADLSPAEIQAAEDDLKQAIILIEEQKYEEAIPIMLGIYNGDIGADADTLNYLGFAHRKLGRKEDALRYYEEALELEPEHLGANEYLGELFIQTGELDKAATQLEILTKLCGSCEESEMLAEAISQAQAGETHSSLRW